LPGVKSEAQKPDLLNQQAVLRDDCEQQSVRVDEWINEIGGGLNFERKQFLKLIDAILAGDVACVVLAHQDRPARLGYQLLVHLCRTHQCKLVVMNAAGFDFPSFMVSVHDCTDCALTAKP
jgi:putative resolvase